MKSNDNTFIMSPKVDFCFKELLNDEDVRQGFIAAILEMCIRDRQGMNEAYLTFPGANGYMPWAYYVSNLSLIHISHISTLLLTFLYRFMPDLIKEGYVYLAQPPLYKLEKNKKVWYAYSDEELDSILQEVDVYKRQNQYYKEKNQSGIM